MRFPEGFVFGAATSAYQIEGGRIDGKGQSIWDTFSDQGRLRDRGDVACDHYHRWPEDVALMKKLGLDGYRMSIAWTRVLPDGTGSINQKGIDFYKKLIDRILEAGITPWVTLYHWDLPQVIQDKGGWADRSSVDAFVNYSEVIAMALGDRVNHWITHNEPWVAAVLGHIDGEFAPGLADWDTGLRAGHHILLSHGRALDVLREYSTGSAVGISLDCRPARPATDSPEDVAAWRHFDGYRNRWFFDPVFGRGYPEDMVEDYRRIGRIADMEWIHSGDLETISSPIDFLGLNYYTSLVIAAGQEEGEHTGISPGPNSPPGFTEMGWPIRPESLTKYLHHIHKEYWQGPIYITENGASYSDGPGSDGEIHDTRRIAYFDAHLRAIEQAIDGGVPVGGYFHWTLIDNVEWVSGFSQRFGLIYFDQTTGERTPKESFDWYRRLIAQNGPMP